MTKPIGHWQRATLAAAAIAIFAGLSAQQLMARAVTVAVGTCVSGVTQYTTIQSAVTAVAAGSTIKVCPGNYPEQVVIEKNLTLEGVTNGTADDPVVVMPVNGFVANTTDLYDAEPLAAQILVQNTGTEDVTISNIAVDGTNNAANCAATPLVGIYYQDASGTINEVVARNQIQQPGSLTCSEDIGFGIYVESASPSRWRHPSRGGSVAPTADSMRCSGRWSKRPCRRTW